MTKVIKVSDLGAPQGDVPIRKVDVLTPGGKLTSKRIVALGETTGHHHEILGECQVYEVARNFGGSLFPGFEIVVGEAPVSLFHKSGGEHDTIEMTPGVWFIPAPGYQQVEYDGRNERRVMD